MKLIDDRTGIEFLDRDACLRLLTAHAFGRVAVLSGGRPVILPVNYAMDGDTVVFRSAPGTKLSAAVRAAPVCFEIDHTDPVFQTGWSVVVNGWAEEAVREETLERLAALPLRSWAPHELDHWVVITPERMSGRRVVAVGREDETAG